MSEIPPDELRKELDRLIEVLEENNICINFLKPRPDDEVYAFIVDELMNMEIEDVRAGGYVTNFIYEEFHPDDEEDSKAYAQDFLKCLLSRGNGYVEHLLSEEELRTSNGEPISVERMLANILAFQSRFLTFTTTVVSMDTVELTGDYATVRGTVSWSGLEGSTMQVVSNSGDVTLQMKKCTFGGWDVVQAIVPGWEA